MINLNKVTFIKSAPSINEVPEKRLTEIVFVGRSNVGKSSLLNGLVRQNIAKVSKKPGKTIYLNYFLVDDTFYLVDVPGYGYAKGGQGQALKFGKMMEGYFDHNDHLKAIFLLLDSRHYPSLDDLSFLNLAKSKQLPLHIVWMKTDKLKQKDKAELNKTIKSLAIESHLQFFVSSLQTETLTPLKQFIEQLFI